MICVTELVRERIEKRRYGHCFRMSEDRWSNKILDWRGRPEVDGWKVSKRRRWPTELYRRETDEDTHEWNPCKVRFNIVLIFEAGFELQISLVDSTSNSTNCKILVKNTTFQDFSAPWKIESSNESGSNSAFHLSKFAETAKACEPKAKEAG